MEKLIHNIWIDLHQELRKFIFNKVKDQDITNDILQETFLKIHLSIHKLNDSSKLTPWVYQITRNSVTDYFRKRKQDFQLHEVDFAVEETEEPLYQSLTNCINNKINALPENYKQAVILTSFEHDSQTELAEELKISYSGAKSRVQRAREKLKELILNCANAKSDGNGNIINFTTDEK